MPKKDGTPTALERRDAENYRRIAALNERSAQIEDRFEALRLEVAGPLSVASLPLEERMEQQEVILDRLEQIKTTLDLDEGDGFKLRRIRRILEGGMER